jgi:hypothetical protein
VLTKWVAGLGVAAVVAELCQFSPIEKLSSLVRCIDDVHSGALDAADAGILANFHLAAPGKGKKSKTYSKTIGLKSAVYSLGMVALHVSDKLASSPAPQLRITASGILDALGRPFDSKGDGRPGGDYVALLAKAGAHPAIVSGAAKVVLGSAQ